jgi:hypothetical protein
MAFYRARLNRKGILDSAGVRACADGQTVRAAGMAVVHQSPPTAKGMHFLTLEDESGFINVVVRPQVPGEITGTATCGSEILDPLKANNTASVKTIVEALHLEFGRSGSSLVIAWPASAANAVLEGASSLAPPVVWLPVTNPPPVEANGLKSVTLPIGSGSGYYRLRLNAP